MVTCDTKVTSLPKLSIIGENIRVESLSLLKIKFKIYLKILMMYDNTYANDFKLKIFDVYIILKVTNSKIFT